jgi:hypothetical protein
MTRRSMNCRETKRECANIYTVTGIEKIFNIGQILGHKKHEIGERKKNVGDDVIDMVVAKNQFRYSN